MSADRIQALIGERLQSVVASASAGGYTWQWPEHIQTMVHRVWERCHNWRQVDHWISGLVTVCCNHIQNLGDYGTLSGKTVSLQDKPLDVDMGESDGNDSDSDNSEDESDNSITDIVYNLYLDQVLITDVHSSLFDLVVRWFPKSVNAIQRAIQGRDVQVLKIVLECWKSGEHLLIDGFYDRVEKALGESLFVLVVKSGYVPLLRALLDFPGRKSIHDSLVITTCQNLPDHTAAPMVRALLERSPSEIHDATDGDENTALHWAVTNELSETIRVLLEFGAKWGVRNKERWTAIYGIDGKMCRNRDIIDLYVRRCNPPLQFFVDYIKAEPHIAEDHVSKAHHLLVSLKKRQPDAFNLLLDEGEFFARTCRDVVCVGCLKMILDVTEWDLSHLSSNRKSGMDIVWEKHQQAHSNPCRHRKIAKALRCLRMAGATMSEPLNCDFCRKIVGLDSNSESDDSEGEDEDDDDGSAPRSREISSSSVSPQQGRGKKRKVQVESDRSTKRKRGPQKTGTPAQQNFASTSSNQDISSNSTAPSQLNQNPIQNGKCQRPKCKSGKTVVAYDRCLDHLCLCGNAPMYVPMCDSCDKPAEKWANQDKYKKKCEKCAKRDRERKRQ